MKCTDCGINPAMPGDELCFVCLSDADKASLHKMLEPKTQDPAVCSDELLAAIKPFAEAYEQTGHKSYQAADSDKFREFLDGNCCTPSMTMGDFRRLFEAYNS